MRWLTQLAEWVYPATCPGCRRPGHAVFCEPCRVSLQEVPPFEVGGVTVVCGARYAGPMRRAVLDLKSGGRTCLAEPLARWMTACLRRVLPAFHPDAVVAVPSSPRRGRWRGYHPAGLLARAVARHLGVSCAPQGLFCRREVAEQKGLSRIQRRRNLRGAFAASPVGEAVLLVDDVVTTGETVRGCAEALRRVGTRRLVALAAGRSDLTGG